MFIMQSIFLVLSFTFKILTLGALLYGIMKTLDYFVGYKKSCEG